MHLRLRNDRDLSFWWGNRTLGFRAGLAGAFILCLSARFLYQSRMITTDGLLCLCVVAAWALGQRAGRRGRPEFMWCALSAIACGLGVLTKGPVALALIIVPLFVHQMLCKRTFRQMLRFFLPYLAIALGLAAPWFAIMAWRDPIFLREFFWTHHVVMRFLRPLHEEPAWFYVPALLVGMLPWTLLLPAVVKSVFRSSGPEDRPAELRYVLLCCLWCLVFFSTASCKRIGYILPAMPTLALALGHALDRQLANPVSIAWTSIWHGWGSLVPYWATQGVLATGIATAVLACATGLANLGPCIAMVTAAALLMGFLAHGLRGGTCKASWLACGLSTFATLFLTLHVLLPGYYRKFSIRTELRSLAAHAGKSGAPLACYPHSWDSAHFYLGCPDARTYGPIEKELLFAHLHARPDTLLLVKSGHALDDLLRALPGSLKFVPVGRPGSITTGIAVAGLIRSETEVINNRTH